MLTHRLSFCHHETHVINHPVANFDLETLWFLRGFGKMNTVDKGREETKAAVISCHKPHKLMCKL